ncbi:MAG: sugar transferase [Chloroflexi bacterium]|nr:MAG: sugar transferase [Chloroflexota bacterium]
MRGRRRLRVLPIPRHRVRSISWVTGDDQVSCDPRVASGCVVLDEKVSRLTLDPAFRLDAPPAKFPVDPGLDLSALSPSATAAGRIAIRAAIPIADATALLATLVITANTHWIGLSFALLALAGLAATGKHDARVDLRVLKDAPAIAAWVAIALTGTLVLAPSAQVDARLRLALVGFGALLLGRLLAYAAIRAMRSHHLARERTLIIGAGPLSTQLATTLADHPEFGLQPIGFLDARRIASGASMAVLGDYSSLERVVREFEVRRVIIGFGDNLDLAQMVRSCQALRVRTHLIARGADLAIAPDAQHVDDVLGISLLRVPPPALGRPGRLRAKRALDVTAAFALLAVSAPIFVTAAAAVRLSSPGPVFFRQRRIGRGGRRITPVGRLLRKTSIDELPQLYNVLRGDMSLIGPRPERPHFVEQFGAEVPHYEDRHRAPVGITGWAQVNKLRGDSSITERVRMDNYYIEHWSPWLDLVIVLRTVGEIIRCL